ncbi:bifunctional phosphopantothenoylcysteine decarboxylase/phosphopantothenate--cysteine ligase CoaBC [Corynebacterium caspium]|uniref:bifunctional phosphopantothenoylcysteine decarboxylase/phosphopantothenate--cysteine ligase CoaBC n=1 Tax=Corynebacterium caspium TaxID=234828 RepID=UPI0003688BAD|nr:bifunctional phosphopantothenoylcysteine decarboxylase/phosphopantothenate--cysteine ligase CoaBC [Corynebacterium caspium]WKD59220.1 Coenzyme A biosynthesis bifunctional protein CoaBC [Corynebacterium caspium DSM 44850]
MSKSVGRNNSTTSGQSEALRLIVGVSGGIAAYKACHLVRLFKEDGAEVRVIPTPNALQFVGAATFEALSGNPVSTTVFSNIDTVQHVRLGQEADGIIIAPATADLIARLAAGRVDDLLSATVLVATCPIILAPAMHTEMWLNPATVENIATLRRRGITVLEPASGRLTGVDSGPGRLLEPAQIAALSRTVLAGQKIVHNWAGKQVLITAGGTQEDIDPVRFIGNRSSGKQGFALAELAAQRGAQVNLVVGDTDELPTPAGAHITKVRSAREMAAAVADLAPQADIVIMAAAVADFRPANPAAAKLKKGQHDESLAQLEMVENPDILSTTVKRRSVGEIPAETVIVGFAAETGDAQHSPLELAQAKLHRKGCDLLIYNDVSAGKTFGAPTNEGWILSEKDSVSPRELQFGSKQVVAAQILAAIDELLKEIA